MKLLQALPLLSWMGVVGTAYASSSPSEPKYHTVPPLREQAAIQDAWTAERKTIIPGLLHKYGVDAWLLSQHEYAEDTAFWSLKSATQFSARRRTTILYIAGNSSDAAETAGLSARTQVLVDKTTGRTATEYYWIDNTPALWSELQAVLGAAGPTHIAINAAEDLAFASGLHAGELSALQRGLGPRWAARLVSDVPLLAIEFVATMVPSRLAWYRRLQETAWAVIAEAFSNRVVVPGTTTTTDVEWWMRDRLQAENVTTWFHPSVSVLKGDDEPFAAGKSVGADAVAGPVIQYGDLLHVDFGLTALGLNTDTQHLGYVVPPGKKAADGDYVPQGLREGLRRGNRLQDLTRHAMARSIGRSGNAILQDIRSAMAREGLEGKIYCHPIGDWGHSAGAVIGMTNLQDRVPVLGDVPLLSNTYYSVELSATYFVPEWNASVIFPLEEDVYWAPETKTWEWVQGRQERFHLVLPQEEDSDGPGEL